MQSVLLSVGRHFIKLGKYFGKSCVSFLICLVFAPPFSLSDFNQGGIPPIDVNPPPTLFPNVNLPRSPKSAPAKYFRSKTVTKNSPSSLSILGRRGANITQIGICPPTYPTERIKLYLAESSQCFIFNFCKLIVIDFLKIVMFPLKHTFQFHLSCFPAALQLYSSSSKCVPFFMNLFLMQVLWSCPDIKARSCSSHWTNIKCLHKVEIDNIMSQSHNRCFKNFTDFRRK